MKLCVTLLAGLVLASSPLPAQSNQSKPSAYNPAPRDQTAAPKSESPPKSATPPPANAAAPHDHAAHPAPAKSTQSTAASTRPSHNQPSTPTPASAPAGAPPTATPSAGAIASAAPKPDANAHQPPRLTVQLASRDAKSRTADKLIGRHVRSTDRGDLGKVKDFLIDTQTGQAELALVSSGGFAGVGDKLHLVPVAALQRSGRDEFLVEMSEERWKALATFDEKRFESGRLALSDSERREITGHFAPSAATANPSPYRASLTAHLVRASDLAGRDVRSGHDRLGEIEHVVLDLEAGTAQAMIDPAKEVTGINDKLLVPIPALTIGEGKRPQVTTLISRADFQQLSRGGQMASSAAASPASPQPMAPPAPTASPAAEKSNAPPAIASTEQSQDIAGVAPPPPNAGENAKASPRARTGSSAGTIAAAGQRDSRPVPMPDRGNNDRSTDAATRSRAATDRSGQVAATGRPADAPDEKLTPTGTTSADAVPPGTDPALLASARAVRKALDQDAALRQTDVRVTAEDGRIVLRGRVSDQKTKSAIIQTATKEIKGWKFDDQISVDRR